MFPGNPFAHPGITILSIIRLVLPGDGMMEGRVPILFDKDISRSPEVGPTIRMLVMI